jgi:ADP-ribosylglycohydrolase/protein-tyrosine phosphatase
MHPPPLANSFWIEPGRVLAGEYPGERDPAVTRKRLAALLDAGISYFIDLTQSDELPPYDHLLPAVRSDDGRYVVYVRKPIVDHGLPSAPGVMRDILDYLDRALEVGHQVYLHCHAGIGRTNTVLGCWLRRAGLTGPESIARLNELWRSNERSRTWPSVPELPAQTRYVLEWSEDGGVELDLDGARSLRNRYLGCVLGLACGDAMGATLQYRRPGQFTPIGDLIGGGHWQLPPGAWTDDTALALCVAASFLEREGFDAGDLLRRYRHWQQQGEPSSTGQCIGISATVAAALQTEPKPLAAQPRTVRPDAEALTRVGIVILFAASLPETAIAWALATVALTERSPEMEMACRDYACLLLAALRGTSRDTLIPDARALWRELGAEGRSVLDGSAACEPLQLVLRALQASVGFRDGLLQVVNLGGNADIHGALFGQLAGAFYGVEGIPKHWRRAVLRRDLLIDTADRLLVAALAPRGDL